jgi:hypothetical protein
VDRIEYTTAEDVFFDYCLWQYTPPAPCHDKFRSVNLLFHSFEIAGVDERMFKLVGLIRDGIGLSRTVWGVNLAGSDMRWEYYFYDYRRRERERSITRILEVISPFVSCEVLANEDLQYFMFSIDMDNDLVSGIRGLDAIHMYIGNVGSTVSSGICYSLTKGGSRLENFYFFFDPKTQADQIVGKATSSAYLDSAAIEVERILWPELWNCRVIVVANKQRNDSVYFSGINVDQLTFFMRKMNYPIEIVSFVERNRGNLDHLQYDVGIDYRMEGKDLVFLKSGYYGVF